jgi:hypothetical protein
MFLPSHACIFIRGVAFATSFSVAVVHVLAVTCCSLRCCDALVRRSCTQLRNTPQFTQLVWRYILHIRHLPIALLLVTRCFCLPGAGKTSCSVSGCHASVAQGRPDAALLLPLGDARVARWHHCLAFRLFDLMTCYCSICFRVFRV